MHVASGSKVPILTGNRFTAAARLEVIRANSRKDKNEHQVATPGDFQR